MNRGKQMCIDVADSTSEECTALDETKHFVIVRHGGDGQLRKSGQNYFTLLQITQRDFSNYKGMCEHAGVVEQPGKLFVMGA